jgi:hypothetical protein
MINSILLALMSIPLFLFQTIYLLRNNRHKLQHRLQVVRQH